MVRVAAILALALTLGACNSSHRPSTSAALNARARAARRARRRVAPARARAEGALARLRAEGLPIYCGGRTRPYAALTFDDGPGVYTHLALRILARAHLRATFFLVGRNVDPYARLAADEARARDVLGNHSYTHPVLTALPPSVVESQLRDTSATIRRRAGVSPMLFRPPYGSRDAAVDAVALRLGLVEVLWSVDSTDSLGASYAAIARTVLAGLRPGAIVLLHENRGQTIRALKFLILPALRRTHIRLVTVPQLLERDPPSRAQLRAGRAGCHA